MRQPLSTLSCAIARPQAPRRQRSRRLLQILALSTILCTPVAAHAQSYLAGGERGYTAYNGRTDANGYPLPEFNVPQPRNVYGEPINAPVEFTPPPPPRFPTAAPVEAPAPALAAPAEVAPTLSTPALAAPAEEASVAEIPEAVPQPSPTENARTENAHTGGTFDWAKEALAIEKPKVVSKDLATDNGDSAASALPPRSKPLRGMGAPITGDTRRLSSIVGAVFPDKFAGHSQTQATVPAPQPLVDTVKAAEAKPAPLAAPETMAEEPQRVEQAVEKPAEKPAAPLQHDGGFISFAPPSSARAEDEPEAVEPTRRASAPAPADAYPTTLEAPLVENVQTQQAPIEAYAETPAPERYEAASPTPAESYPMLERAPYEAPYEAPEPAYTPADEAAEVEDEHSTLEPALVEEDIITTSYAPQRMAAEPASGDEGLSVEETILAMHSVEQERRVETAPQALPELAEVPVEAQAEEPVESAEAAEEIAELSVEEAEPEASVEAEAEAVKTTEPMVTLAAAPAEAEREVDAVLQEESIAQAEMTTEEVDIAAVAPNALEPEVAPVIAPVVTPMATPLAIEPQVETPAAYEAAPSEDVDPRDLGFTDKEPVDIPAEASIPEAAAPLPIETETPSAAIPAAVELNHDSVAPLPDIAAEPKVEAIAPFTAPITSDVAVEAPVVTDELSEKSRFVLEHTPAGIGSRETVAKSPEPIIIKRESPEAGKIPTVDVRAHEELGLKIEIRKANPNLNAYLEEAYNNLMAGRYEIAAGFYQETLKMEPKNEAALFGLATTYQKLGQNEQARDYYARLLAFNPTHREALNNFMVLVGEEAPQSAVGELIRMEQQNPDFSPIPAQLGILYTKLGEYRQAVVKLLRAVSLSPENLSYKYNLAIALDKLGDREQASELYLELIEQYKAGAQIPGNIETIRNRVIFLNRVQ